MKYSFFALLFLFAFAASADDFLTQKAALDSEKASLDGDIKKLNIQITQTDSMAAVEKQYGQQQQVKQKADLERRQSEIEDLKGKLSEISAEMQRERNSLSFSQTQIDNAEATRKALGSQLASHCRRLEVFIKGSLPWDSESRLERVAALCRDLENGNATAEEGFSRLKAVYAEEIRFGDEVQVSSRPIIRNDGEIVNASVLRIGNQWIVYQDDAGHLFGVLNRKIAGDGIYEYAWKEDLSFEERQAIKNAIDVKLSRKPPQMVKLPLSLSVLGK
jgi:hypothetical protein